MEKAASRWLEYARPHFQYVQNVTVLCGPGNNGGDGLVIGRLLASEGYEVNYILLKKAENCSPDFKLQFEKLAPTDDQLTMAGESESVQSRILSSDLIVDALFGTGLSRPLEGMAARLTEMVNLAKKTVFAVDIPSGLFSGDELNESEHTVISASHTFTFNNPKPAFFFSENETYVGELQIVPIELVEKEEIKPYADYFTLKDAQSLNPAVSNFSHKGNFGHVLVQSGEQRTSGAALLSAQAALHTGAGLVSIRPFHEGESILNRPPEIMEAPELSDEKHYNLLVIGPGLGLQKRSKKLLEEGLNSGIGRLVLDADALNLLAEDSSLWELVPKGTLLTPHPGEMKRLCEGAGSSAALLSKARDLAQAKGVFIILKGAYSRVIDPGGNLSFNSSGNYGMGTAGSGDVLTGISAAFLARSGISSYNAVKLACFIHGLAGDMAAYKVGKSGITAPALIDFIGPALKLCNR